MSHRREPLDTLLRDWPVSGPSDEAWEARAIQSLAAAEAAGETPSALLAPPPLAPEPGEPGASGPGRSLAELARAKLEAERLEAREPAFGLGALVPARAEPALPPAERAALVQPPVASPQRPAVGAPPVGAGGGGRWRSSTVLAVALAVGAAGLAIGLGPLGSRPMAGSAPSAGAAIGAAAPSAAAVSPAAEPLAVAPAGDQPAAAPAPIAGRGGVSGAGGVSASAGAGPRVVSSQPAGAPPPATVAERGPPPPGEDDPPPLPGARNAEKGAALPEKPSAGAVQAALGAVMGAARACVAGHEQPSSVTVTFGSDGRVQSVAVASGPAVGGPAAACLQAALGRARVEPFARATFSVGATVRPP